MCGKTCNELDLGKKLTLVIRALRTSPLLKNIRSYGCFYDEHFCLLILGVFLLKDV